MPKSHERQSLLDKANASQPSSFKDRFFNTVRVMNSIPDGMAKAYASFGPLAIMYERGLWLIAPVFGGGAISLSEEVFKHCKKKYPNNSLINMLEKVASSGNQVVIGFCEDFGFSLSLVLTLASQMNANFITNNIKIAGPVFSGIVAPGVRYIRLTDKQAQSLKLRVLEIAAYTIRASYSSTFVTGLLQQQGIIPNDSLIPMAAIGFTSVIGFIAGLVKNKYPNADLLLMTLIEIMFENPSLTAAFFAFPNDIYAASNPKNEISDSFFFGNAGISFIYLILLTVVSANLAHKKWKQLNPQPLIEPINENPDDIESQREMHESVFVEEELLDPNQLPRQYSQQTISRSMIKHSSEQSEDEDRIISFHSDQRPQSLILSGIHASIEVISLPEQNEEDSNEDTTPIQIASHPYAFMSKSLPSRQLVGEDLQAKPLSRSVELGGSNPTSSDSSDSETELFHFSSDEEGLGRSETSFESGNSWF